MFGVLDVYCMKYGVLDIDHLRILTPLRLYIIWSTSLSLSVILQYLEKIMDGCRLPPPPGCPREIYHIMIQCWLVTLLINDG